MTGSADRVAAFVEDLVQNRRPRRFKASAAEVDALKGAAALRSARPGADLPDCEFVAWLGRQLQSQTEGPISRIPARITN
jgi:hypothetical protein